jgi:GNAT superfamily N-acetyltransferase
VLLETPYRFELFGKQHKPLRASFSCGEEALEAYLKTRARKEMDNSIAVVYVLRDAVEDRIAGYYTLSSLSIELPEEMRKDLAKYPEYPATLIGRLAVDESYQGRGLGKRILFDALGRALAGSRAVASYAVITDAKNEQAQAFYSRYGFSPLPAASGGRRLILPMGTVEKLFPKH